MPIIFMIVEGMLKFNTAHSSICCKEYILFKAFCILKLDILYGKTFLFQESEAIMRSFS